MSNPHPRHKAITRQAANKSLSICMATYNGGRYIREQVASILPQLGPNGELVVVDDASADDTVDIVRAFGDERIRIIQQSRNCGVLTTFELAMREAAGDIVFLCDQDDIWHPEKVGTFLRTFDYDPRITLVLSDGELMDENGNCTGERLNCETRFRSGVIANLIKNRYQGCTMAFRREILEAALPFPDGIPMHDSWIGLVNAIVGRATYLNTKLVFYRRHQSNVTSRRHGTMTRMLAQRWYLAIGLISRAGALIHTRRQLRSRTRIALRTRRTR